MLRRLEPALRNVTIEGNLYAAIRKNAERLLAQSRKLQETVTATIADQERMRERMRVFKNLMSQARFEDAFNQGKAIVQDALPRDAGTAHGRCRDENRLLAHHLREVRELVTQRLREERF